jgi:hypothetical protein
MSIQSFFDTYTDPNNPLNILCDKDTLIQFIQSTQTIKKQPNSFVLWKNDNSELIKHTYFDDYDSISDWSYPQKKKYYTIKHLPIPKKQGKPKLVELITIKASILWKNVDDHIKIEYDLKRQTPAIFQGYSTPYYGYTIKSTVKQNGKTVKAFNNIHDAIETSNKFGNRCYGITQTKSGKYSLRHGLLLKDSKSECSWIKTDYVSPKQRRGRPKTRCNYVSDSESE